MPIQWGEPKIHFDDCYCCVELNDLITDLQLRKESAEVFVSKLKDLKLVGARLDSDVLSYKRARLAIIF